MRGADRLLRVTLPDGASNEITETAEKILDRVFRRMMEAEMNVALYGSPGLSEEWEWEAWRIWNSAASLQEGGRSDG